MEVEAKQPPNCHEHSPAENAAQSRAQAGYRGPLCFVSGPQNSDPTRALSTLRLPLNPTPAPGPHLAPQLQAVSAMASGLGPLVFAAVFRAVTRTDSPLPPMSGVVWYMAVAMTAVAIALTISLPDHHQQGQQKKDQQGGRQAGQGEGKVDAGGISRLGRQDVEAVGGEEEGRWRAAGVPEEEKEEGLREREEGESRGSLRQPLLQGQAPGGV